LKLGFFANTGFISLYYTCLKQKILIISDKDFNFTPLISASSMQRLTRVSLTD